MFVKFDIREERRSVVDKAALNLEN